MESVLNLDKCFQYIRPCDKFCCYLDKGCCQVESVVEDRWHSCRDTGQRDCSWRPGSRRSPRTRTCTWRHNTTPLMGSTGPPPPGCRASAHGGHPGAHNTCPDTCPRGHSHKTPRPPRYHCHSDRGCPLSSSVWRPPLGSCWLCCTGTTSCYLAGGQDYQCHASDGDQPLHLPHSLRCHEVTQNCGRPHD